METVVYLDVYSHKNMALCCVCIMD